MLVVFAAMVSLSAGVKKSFDVQKKLQRLSWNVSEAISSLKNSLNLDSASDSATASLDGHSAMLIQKVSEHEPQGCQVWCNEEGISSRMDELLDRVVAHRLFLQPQQGGL
ncbi:hypothetical protein ACFX11_023037 [Malus domestica]